MAHAIEALPSAALPSVLCDGDVQQRLPVRDMYLYAHAPAREEVQLVRCLHCALVLRAALFSAHLLRCNAARRAERELVAAADARRVALATPALPSSSSTTATTAITTTTTTTAIATATTATTVATAITPAAAAVTSSIAWSLPIKSLPPAAAAAASTMLPTTLVSSASEPVLASGHSRNLALERALPPLPSEATRRMHVVGNTSAADSAGGGGGGSSDNALAPAYCD